MRRRALGRHLDARAAREARTRRSATSSPPSLRVARAPLSSAPISRSVVRSPVRSGLVITLLEDHLRARHDQRRHQRKGGRRRIGRHHAPARASAPAGPQRDAAAVLAVRLDRARRRRNARASARYGRGVASLSITVVAPGAARPASSTADLICADGTGGGRRSGSDRARPRASSAGGRLRRPHGVRARSARAGRACAASAACAARRRRRRSR